MTTVRRSSSDSCCVAISEACTCPVEGILDIVSKKWSLLIVGVIGYHGRLRYNQLKEELGTISPKGLADRLKELQSVGLIRKRRFAERPPRVEYSLTKDGERFRKAMIPLMQWASKRT